MKPNLTTLFATAFLGLLAGWPVHSARAATSVVTNLADSGSGTLRAAVAFANTNVGGALITFGPALSGQSITLTSGQMLISNTVTIDASALLGGVIISGRTNSRVFRILPSGTVMLNSLTLGSGSVSNDSGGAILNSGQLTAVNCWFTNNVARGGTGQTCGSGSNGGGGGGGAGMGGVIFSDGPVLSLTNCMFNYNRAIGGDGGTGEGNSFNSDRGGNGGGPNGGPGGALESAGGAGGYGGGGGGGAGSEPGNMGYGGGPGGLGGGGGGGGAKGVSDGGAGGNGGNFGGTGGGSHYSVSGGGGGGAGLGGAVFAKTGAVSLVSCGFDSNLATNGAGGYGSFGAGVGTPGLGVGGAVFSAGANLVLNTSFGRNAASTFAPDLYVATLAPAKIWTGVSSGNWRAGANWTGGAAPANGDEVVFPSGGAANLTNTNDLPNLRLDSIVFAASGYTVRGNPIAVTNGITSQQAAGNVTLENALILGGAQTFDCDNEGAGLILSGNITNAGFTLTLAGMGVVTASGSISGTGGLNVIEYCEAVLSGATANTYSGLTCVSDTGAWPSLGLNKSANTVAVPGNLIIAGGVGLGSSDQIAHTADVLVQAGGSLAINSSWAAIDTLRGSGEVQFGPSGYLNIGVNNGSSTFDGIMDGTGGSIYQSTLLKYGTGTFTLNGNNTYLNGTYVSAGKLVINGFQPSSPVWSEPGTTVAGTGTVGDLGAWGLLTPGSSPGILTCSNLDLIVDGPQATLQVELTGPVAGTDYDQLNVRGTVYVSDALLNVLPNFTKPVGIGQQFVIINNDGADAVNGTFDGLPQGASINAGGYRFTISYVGGTGNDVVLTLADVPGASAGYGVTSGNGNGALEPDECALLTIGLTNKTGTPMTRVTATLMSSDPNVMITQPVVTYPDIPANGMGTNAIPFQVSVLPTLGCASPVNLQLVVSSTSHGRFVLPLVLPSGTPSSTPVRYDKSVITNIPDIGTIESTNVVAGWSAGPLTKVAISLWLTHPIDSDLTLSLISPAGSNVTLVSATGDGANFGSDCSPDAERTTFDDSAPTAISAGTPPFLGTFRPQGSLATFSHTTPNGNWRLRITDSYGGSLGALRCWSLFLYGTDCAGGGACALCAGGTVLTNTMGTNGPPVDGLAPWSGSPPTCAAQTTCTHSGDPVSYQAYPFYNNTSNACVTVTLTSSGSNFWSGAYLGAFTPGSPCANYLARGNELYAPGATTYGFQVPPKSVFTVVVMCWFGLVGPYSLAVSGGDCPPLLNLQPVANTNLDLSWPTVAGGYRLESSPSIATPTVWDPVTNVPIAAASQFHVTNSASSPSNRFYRLHKP